MIPIRLLITAACRWLLLSALLAAGHLQDPDDADKAFTLRYQHASIADRGDPV
jgi:hypothetical protein